MKSKDGVIEIYQALSPSELVFPPSAWSIVNVPLDEKDANIFFNSLFQTVSTKHTMLALCRHKRRDRNSANKNLPSDNWTYLETVSLWYEKPSTCSNNGFLPICEAGWLYYKGNVPNSKNTDWFNPDYNNATNLWNISPQPDEGVEHCYYQKFSWELNLLLWSLSKPFEIKKFLYMLPLDAKEQVSLFMFCKKYNISACLYTETQEETDEIMTNYSKFTGEKK